MILLQFIGMRLDKQGLGFKHLNLSRMNAHKTIIDFVKKNFKAVLSQEEAGELLLLFSYEIEANLQKMGAFEIFKNAFDKYVRQRKLTVTFS